MNKSSEDPIKSVIESKHYFAILIAIVLVAIASILVKQPAPTAPVPLNEQYYYDVDEHSLRHKPVVIEFDSLPFKHAFMVQRNAKGPDGIFYWKGDYYTTNLAGEEMADKKDSSNEYISTRYLVKFNINDEHVSKFFNDETQAYTFAEMVDGTVVKFSETRHN